MMQITKGSQASSGPTATGFYSPNRMLMGKMTGLTVTESNNPAPPPDASGELPETIIRPQPGWKMVNFAELWRSKELLFYLSWRDIKVRYKQTALGIAWAFVQPVFAMLVFTLFLGDVSGLSSGIPHYALFVFAAMLPWTFFSGAISQSGNSIVANERLITKVYFPRLHVPFSSVGSVLFDFLVGFPLLVGMMLWFGVVPTMGMLAAPLIFALLVFMAMGIGALFATLVAVQRDFRYILWFSIQIWMFATPSIYRPLSSMGENARWWAPLNPVHGVIENWRQALMGEPLNWYSLLVSGSVGLLLSVFGLAFYRRMERSFADLI